MADLHLDRRVPGIDKTPRLFRIPGETVPVEFPESHGHAIDFRLVAYGGWSSGGVRIQKEYLYRLFESPFRSL